MVFSNNVRNVEHLGKKTTICLKVRFIVSGEIEEFNSCLWCEWFLATPPPVNEGLKALSLSTYPGTRVEVLLAAAGGWGGDLVDNIPGFMHKKKAGLHHKALETSTQERPQQVYLVLGRHVSSTCPFPFQGRVQVLRHLGFSGGFHIISYSKKYISDVFHIFPK